MRSAILAEVQTYPGSYSAADIASQLRLRPSIVRAATRAGLIAPRRWRLTQNARASLQGGRAVARLVWGSSTRSDGLELAARAVRALRIAPLAERDLAQILTGGSRLAGGSRRALAGLERIGIVSPPSCLWPAVAS